MHAAMGPDSIRSCNQSGRTFCRSLPQQMREGSRPSSGYHSLDGCGNGFISPALPRCGDSSLSRLRFSCPRLCPAGGFRLVMRVETDTFSNTKPLTDERAPPQFPQKWKIVAGRLMPAASQVVGKGIVPLGAKPGKYTRICGRFRASLKL